MIEKYVRIKEYPNYYISNFGNVRNKKGAQLKPRKAKSGYTNVFLYKNNKGHNVYIHRLVAMAFIPNPNNLPQVNHLDENKKNNYSNNLEWCTARHNLTYGTRIERMLKNRNYTSNKGSSRSMSVYNKEDNITTTFKSVKECSEVIGISAPQIRNIISGKTKHTHKFDKYTFSYI